MLLIKSSMRAHFFKKTIPAEFFKLVLKVYELSGDNMYGPSVLT